MKGHGRAGAGTVDDRPLEVALVHVADAGGGAETCTLALHRGLRAAGHRSRLFVAAKTTDEPGVHQIDRPRVLRGLRRAVRLAEDRTGLQYLYRPGFRRLAGQIGRADVVHFQSLWKGREGYADLAGLRALMRHHPCVMTLHDLWMLTGHCALPAPGCGRWEVGCGNCPDLSLVPPVSRDATRLNHARKRRAVAGSDLRVTTVSRWLEGLARRSPVFAGCEVSTVYNGVSREDFRPRDRAAVRAAWDLPADATVVLLTGKAIEGYYGETTGSVDCSLRALAACRGEVFPLAVGRSAAAFLERAGVSGRAEPFQTDPVKLGELYAAADVTLVPSMWETFGRVPAESLMCGTPVAGFATGGIPEVAPHEEAGLLVPTGDGEALGRALRRLVRDRPLRERLGRVGAERAARLFSNETVTEQYVSLYRAAIAARAAARAGRPAPEPAPAA